MSAIARCWRFREERLTVPALEEQARGRNRKEQFQRKIEQGHEADGLGSRQGASRLAGGNGL